MAVMAETMTADLFIYQCGNREAVRQRQHYIDDCYQKKYQAAVNRHAQDEITQRRMIKKSIKEMIM